MIVSKSILLSSGIMYFTYMTRPQTHHLGHRKRVQASSYGVPGYKPRNFWTPSANKNAHTRLSGANIFYLDSRIGLNLDAIAYTSKPTIIDVVFYPKRSFRRLFWNTTMIVWCCYVLCMFLRSAIRCCATMRFRIEGGKGVPRASCLQK